MSLFFCDDLKRVTHSERYFAWGARELLTVVVGAMARTSRMDAPRVEAACAAAWAARTAHGNAPVDLSLLRGTRTLEALLAPWSRDQHLRIWLWEDAPPQLRELSRCGGDEDFVAYLPPTIPTWQVKYVIDVLDTCRDPQVVNMDHLGTVYIGSHA